MRKSEKNKKYVIGVDGGGTKTTTALASLKGKIFKVAETGSSNPRNFGLGTAVENVAQGINKVKRGDILSIFVGLPAVEEEYKNKKEKIKKEILKRISIDRVNIGSDQLVAFRAGSDEREGVMIIAGTGCVAHGWHRNLESKTNGWGWLADEGSAFWTGQQVLQAVFKDIDNRGPETTLTKMVLKKFRAKKPEDLLKKIYHKDFVKEISQLSILCDRAAERGNKAARSILRRGGEEASLALRTVITELRFKKKKFPIVLVGSMFESDLFLKTVKLYTKSLAPRAEFILPRQKPVIGAIKLAIENYNEYQKV